MQGTKNTAILHKNKKINVSKLNTNMCTEIRKDFIKSGDICSEREEEM